jgi:membrane protein YqaA with SNARE-associated domain
MFWLSVFGMSFAAGVLPGFALELYVVGVGSLVGRAEILPLILLSASGQVLGKVVVYAVAAAGGSLTGRACVARGRWRALSGRMSRCVPLIVFVSALASVPPYHLTTIACGVSRSGVVPFALAGFAGRAFRTGVLIAMPRLVLEVLR